MNKYPGVYWSNELKKFIAAVTYKAEKHHLGCHSEFRNAKQAVINFKKEKGIPYEETIPSGWVWVGDLAKELGVRSQRLTGAASNSGKRKLTGRVFVADGKNRLYIKRDEKLKEYIRKMKNPKTKPAQVRKYPAGCFDPSRDMRGIMVSEQKLPAASSVDYEYEILM